MCPVLTRGGQWLLPTEGRQNTHSTHNTCAEPREHISHEPAGAELSLQGPGGTAQREDLEGPAQNEGLRDQLRAWAGARGPERSPDESEGHKSTLHSRVCAGRDQRGTKQPPEEVTARKEELTTGTQPRIK